MGNLKLDEHKRRVYNSRKNSMQGAGIQFKEYECKVMNGHQVQGGVDVSLALELYIRAASKRYSRVILVAGDGDFAPCFERIRELPGRPRMVLVSAHRSTSPKLKPFIDEHLELEDRSVLEQIIYVQQIKRMYMYIYVVYHDQHRRHQLNHNKLRQEFHVKHLQHLQRNLMLNLYIILLLTVRKLVLICK